MNDLIDEIKAMRATRLKVGILSFLSKSAIQMRYVNTVRLVFSWPTDEEFATAIATLVEQNLVTQTKGRQGGPRLILVEGESNGEQIAEYNRELAALTSPPALGDLAGLDEEIKLRGMYWNAYYKAYRGWGVTTTWRKIYTYISPYLVKHPPDGAVKEVLLSALFAQAQVDGELRQASLDDQDFQTVGVQLKALGLVNIEYTQTTAGGMGLFWTFTAKGERLMVELRAVRSKETTAGTPIPT
jgi:hypothetical protein